MTYVKLFQKAKVETTSSDSEQTKKKEKNWQTKETDTLFNICCKHTETPDHELAGVVIK